jgi:hypothetical protein
LMQLALTEQELHALTDQGFISSEMRGSRKVFRLRFRVDGRQHVRCVSAANAPELAAELAELQARRRTLCIRRKVMIEARRLLRTQRHESDQILDLKGYHRHGGRIRRRRAKRPKLTTLGST